VTGPRDDAAVPFERILKSLLKAPVVLYSAGAGWVFGKRFLLLTHRGRRSGRLHRTVLEVVAWRPEANEAIVMSGFGTRSQWYRNIVAGGAEEMQIATRRFVPRIRVLDHDEALDVLRDYEFKHWIAAPLVRRLLSQLLGFKYRGWRLDGRRAVEVLPLVSLSPRTRSQS
jgi:deazaflavin-dependent oxidoreductase (nitroreductase family)